MMLVHCDHPIVDITTDYSIFDRHENLVLSNELINLFIVTKNK